MHEPIGSGRHNEPGEDLRASRDVSHLIYPPLGPAKPALRGECRFEFGRVEGHLSVIGWVALRRETTRAGI
jgi:hypothetical protein